MTRRSAIERATEIAERGKMAVSRGKKIASILVEAIGLDPNQTIPDPQTGWPPGATRFNKVLTEGPPKDPSRIVEKTAGKVENASDPVRFMVVFNHASQIILARRVLPRHDQRYTELTREWEQKDFDLTEIEDTFYHIYEEHGENTPRNELKNPRRYRKFGVEGVLHLPKGRPINLQIDFTFVNCRITNAYTHGIFEEHRELKERVHDKGLELNDGQKRRIEEDDIMCASINDRDMRNPEYGLSILAGNPVEIAHFETMIRQHALKSSSRKKVWQAPGVNTPWLWLAENFPPENER